MYCFSIGLLEETAFRGCVLPLFLIKFSKDKKGIFWAVVASSLVFGAVHLLNLLNGFSPAVFLQVGYSFLIGATCGFALIVSGNIYLPIILHGVFNVGGMFFSESFAQGVLWTGANVVWTIITSIVFCVIIVMIFIKKDFSHVRESWNLNRVAKAREEE